MSHTSTVKGIQIMDEEALKSAAIELSQRGVNCELVQHVKPRAYYDNQAGMQDAADFCLKLNAKPYDVGFYKQADGSYEPRCDFWAGHVEDELGIDKPKTDQDRIGKLLQMYGVHATTRKATLQGYQVQRMEREDGTITLQMTV